MDKVLFLGFCLFNSLFYVGIKYTHQLYPEFSTAEIAAYSNILSFLIVLPYAIARFSKVVKAFKRNSRLAIVAPAAVTKIVAIQYVSAKSAIVVSFLIPAVVIFLSFVTLNEYDKSQRSRYYWLFVSFLGACIFVGPSDFRSNVFAYTLLFAHLLSKGITHIYIKQLSENKYVALFYSTFYFAAFISIGSFWYAQKFVPSMLLNQYVIYLAIFSVVNQLFMIWSYKIATKISLIQNLDYSRMIFGCIFGYYLTNDPMLTHQYIGLSIVISSMLLSQVANKRVLHILFVNSYPGRFVRKRYHSYKERRSKSFV